jgi:hypothetical protein
MSTSENRRHFLRLASTTGAAFCLPRLAGIDGLRQVTASEATLEPDAVRFSDDIEPLVRLLEDTPRDDLVEQIARRVKGGLTYREVLAALLLAGVRNVQPRPAVGFKFHAVLVVNSAHLASLASPDADRWLPIFWALDYFKSSQARDVEEGNWTMSAVIESAVPRGANAGPAFKRSMDAWDEEAADAAIAGLTRTAGANQLFELFARYGCRDFRSIGHKAIFVANSFRTLQCIGWRYAEPVLRSLTYALLNHTDEPNPAEHDLDPDRPGRRNLELTRQIRSDWQSGKRSTDATLELLAALRMGSSSEAVEAVVTQLNAGVAPQSVYDALLLGSGELLMRQPGIVGLHTLTTSNAMHYIYRTARDEETRKFVLLQNAAFLPLFRSAMHGRGTVGEDRIDELLGPETTESMGLDHVFRSISDNRSAAARSAYQYLQEKQSPEAFINEARRMVFLKGTDSHDYKFSSAVLEDFYHVSPELRNWFLATSVFNLRGSGHADNGLVDRIRSALA